MSSILDNTMLTTTNEQNDHGFSIHIQDLGNSAKFR